MQWGDLPNGARVAQAHDLAKLFQGPGTMASHSRNRKISSRGIAIAQALAGCNKCTRTGGVLVGTAGDGKQDLAHVRVEKTHLRQRRSNLIKAAHSRSFQLDN